MIVILDVETQKVAPGSLQRRRLGALGLAVAVLLYDETGGHRVYFEAEAGDLIWQLQCAQLVVGFGLVRFDYPVLQAYTTMSLDTIPTLDIMEELQRSLGFRPSLDGVARGTLGRRKASHGLQAVRWWRKGLHDKVVAHCLEDVRLIHGVFRFGLNYGRVVYEDRNTRSRTVTVDWATQ